MRFLSPLLDSRNTHRRFVLMSAIFLAFFLLLLLPIPRAKSVMGSVDTLFIPALGDTVANQIRSLFTGEYVGQSMYPAHILNYGETAIGTGSVFVLFRFLGANDVLAIYLVQVLQLTLMAVAAMMLAERLTGSFPAAVLAAFIFTTSNYVWAGIDDLPIHFYFFPLLSMYYLIRAMQEHKGSHLVTAGVMGGLQPYFSMQVYAYQTIMLGVFVLFQWRRLWAFPPRQKAFCVAAYLVVGLPVLAFYLNTALRLHPADPFPRTQLDQLYSLQFPDLLSHLPNKLISYPFTHDSAGGWARVSHSAFPGLVAPLLALAGLFGLNRQKLGLIGIAAVAMFFSLGTSIEIAGRSFESPLSLFYRFVPLAKYLRVEIRAYSLVLVSMSLLAAYGWCSIWEKLHAWKRGLPWAALALTCAAVAAENISWPLNGFETKPYPQVPPGYVEYFRDKPNATILDLPSQGTDWPSYIDDIVYVIWQTKHERNILGGVNGYFPPSRIQTQRFIDKLPSASAFRYFRRLGLTHIVWHKSPFLVCHPEEDIRTCDPATGKRMLSEAQGRPWLDSSQFLTLVFENDALKIYEVHSAAAGSDTTAISPSTP